jgi:CRISPR-associated protein Csm2
MAYQGNRNNHHGSGKKNFHKPKIDLPNLILDYTKDKELFNETAKEYAKAINSTKKTQARNFYDKVLELEAKSQSENWERVLPFVKMLNSKVAYGVSRKVVSFEFETMMNRCVKQVDTKEDLKVFRLFFEAVLGFFKGRD